MYQYLLLLLTILISTLQFNIVQAETHACMHDLLVEDTLATVVVNQNYSGETLPSGNNTRSIRIVFDTSLTADDEYTCYSAGQTVYVGGSSYTCKDADVLSSTKAALLKERMLPDAATRLQEAFKVLKMSGPLYLNADYLCGFGQQVTIPHSFETQGVPNADLVVFVTARPILVDGVIALGSSCQQDQIGRPIAGQLNFNPSYLNTDSFAYDSQLGTAMHEVTHVLGFDFKKFARFNTVNGTKAGYTTTTSNSFANNGERLVTKINTPAVQKWVREHFGCDTLDGAELEDGGTNSTRFSHWEKRLFMNDYMTGSSSTKPIFSGLTLALFEDSGWYAVNYSAAEPLVWGKGEGCGFVQKSCGEWPTNNGYHCSAEAKTAVCSFDHKSKGYCNVGKYTSEVPSQFQYFSDPLLGGTDSLADYCTFNTPYSNGWCVDTSNAGANDDKVGQIYGDDSMCFMSSIVKGKAANDGTQGVCMPSACVSTTQMKVKIGTLWHTCAKDGLQVESGSTGFVGAFKCPYISRVCQGVASTENEWPTIDSVSPLKGSPGTKITIVGSFLNEDIVVTIGDKKCDILSINANGTYMEVQIPASHAMGEAVKVLEEKVIVLVSYPNGRNAFYPGFKYTGSVFFGSIVSWLKRFWWIPLIAGLTLVALIVACVYCIKKKKRNKIHPMKTKDAEAGYYNTKPITCSISVSKEGYEEDYHDADEYYDDDEYYVEEYESDGADVVAKKLEKNSKK